MPVKIKIIVGDVSLDGFLNDAPCARAVADALPITANFNTWGDEFYFEIPVKFPADETATTDVEVGDIGYWPTGSALAVFFGPTPASASDKPVPASKVNLVGKVAGDATILRSVKNEKSIKITVAQ